MKTFDEWWDEYLKGKWISSFNKNFCRDAWHAGRAEILNERKKIKQVEKPYSYRSINGF